MNDDKVTVDMKSCIVKFFNFVISNKIFCDSEGVIGSELIGFKIINHDDKSDSYSNCIKFIFHKDYVEVLDSLSNEIQYFNKLNSFERFLNKIINEYNLEKLQRRQYTDEFITLFETIKFLFELKESNKDNEIFIELAENNENSIKLDNRSRDEQLILNIRIYLIFPSYTTYSVMPNFETMGIPRYDPGFGYYAQSIKREQILGDTITLKIISNNYDNKIYIRIDNESINNPRGSSICYVDNKFKKNNNEFIKRIKDSLSDSFTRIIAIHFN